MSYWNIRSKKPEVDLDKIEVVSRSEYREILLARMAAGDLYAAETLAMVRKADMAFDLLREKPIYKKTNNDPV